MHKKSTSPDPTAAERKRDHIELAFQSQVLAHELDRRFYYEPILSGYPQPDSLPVASIGGKTMRVPIWVSSMTGGTEWAKTINTNLAQACQQFGMGMGLGSCRSLLHDDERLADFDVRPIIGENQPLYANLGIAQIETLIQDGQLTKLNELVSKLSADGLIIHVNPLQEWTQPEGDLIEKSPLESIMRVLDAVSFPIIVKEVGQGMGPNSLRALLKLPLAAVDFAASGGTNFAKLELFRNDEFAREAFGPVVALGHTALEMVGYCNAIKRDLGKQLQCEQLIISGGIGNFLDGYYHIKQSEIPAVYGQASKFLKHARGEYDALERYVSAQIKGLELAYAYLQIRRS